MPFKSLPPWAKGGIILTTVDVVFWLMWIIISGPGRGWIIVGMVAYGPISLLVSLVVGSFMGAIIGYIARRDESNSAKGLKIGFSLGAVLSVAALSLVIIQWAFFATGLNFSPALFTFIIVSIALGSFLGWLIGKFR